MSNIEKYRKGLVCLVPKQGVVGDIDYWPLVSHEKKLCDCQVLEIFAAYDEVVEQNKTWLQMFETGQGQLAELEAKLKIAVETIKSVMLTSAEHSEKWEWRKETLEVIAPDTSAGAKDET